MTSVLEIWHVKLFDCKRTDVQHCEKGSLTTGGRAFDNDVNLLPSGRLGKIVGDIPRRPQLLDAVVLVFVEYFGELLNGGVIVGNVDLIEVELVCWKAIKVRCLLLLDKLLEVTNGERLGYMNWECRGLIVHETEEGDGVSHWC